MIAFPSSVRVWLAVGRTDMRRYAEHNIMRSPRRQCELFSNSFNRMRRRTLRERSA